MRWTLRRAAMLAVWLLASLALGCDAGDAGSDPSFALLEGEAGAETHTAAPVASGSTATSGSLFSRDFKVYWKLYEKWPEGGCVELTVTNNGPAVAGWTLGVNLDGTVTDWLWSGGAYTEEYADFLLVQPEDNTEPLEAGGRAKVTYCTEPRVRPASVKVDVPEQGAGGGSTGSAYNWGSDSGWTSGTFGSGGAAYNYVRWGDFELYASVGTAWETGACVDMILINNGPALSGWQLDVYLDQALVKKTSSDGALFFAAGPHLLAFPKSGGSLAAGGVLGLQYCGEPATMPSAFRIKGTTTSSGWDDGSGSTWSDDGWGTTPCWGSDGSWSEAGTGCSNVPWTPPADAVGKLVGYKDFLLYASDAGDWQDGHGSCVDLTLVNTGLPVVEWTATITLDDDVLAKEIVEEADEGGMTIVGDTITLSGETPLAVFAPGEQKRYQYCTAPDVVPEKLKVSFTMASAEGGGSSGGSSGGGSSGGYPGTSTPSATTFSSGTLWDPTGCFAAPYKKGNESQGGDCMSLQILYVCQDEEKLDALHIWLSKGFKVTDSWPAVAYQYQDGNADFFVAIPGYMATIEHNQSQVFTICGSPLTKPVALQVIKAY